MLKHKNFSYKFLLSLFLIFSSNFSYAKIDIKERSYCLYDAVQDSSYKKMVEQICEEMVGNELIVRVGSGMQVNLGVILDLVKINKGEKVNLFGAPDYSLGDDYAPNSTDIFYIKYNDDYLLIHDPDKNDDEVFYYCISKDNCYQTSTILY